MGTWEWDRTDVLSHEDTALCQESEVILRASEIETDIDNVYGLIFHRTGELGETGKRSSHDCHVITNREDIVSVLLDGREVGTVARGRGVSGRGRRSRNEQIHQLKEVAATESHMSVTCQSHDSLMTIL